jgi:hypothetical protein
LGCAAVDGRADDWRDRRARGAEAGGVARNCGGRSGRRNLAAPDRRCSRTMF